MSCVPILSASFCGKGGKPRTSTCGGRKRKERRRGWRPARRGIESPPAGLVLKEVRTECEGYELWLRRDVLEQEPSFRRSGTVMQNKPLMRSIVVSSSLFVIFLAAILVRAFWISHDSSDLLLHVSILLSIALLTGLFVWYAQRFRYYKLGVAFVQAVGWGGLAIYSWVAQRHFFAVVPALLCVAHLLILVKEIRKLRAFAKPQQKIWDRVTGKE